MKVALNIDGGIGRVICSIPAVEQFCKQHPDTEILCHWPGVFKNNPHIKNIHDQWGSNQRASWSTIVKHSDYRHPEPYQNYLYYTKKHHLIESFHYLINGEAKMERPHLYVSQEERQVATNLIDAIKTQQKVDKVIIIQPFGGTATVQGAQVLDPTYRSMTLPAITYLLDNLPQNTKAIYRGTIPFTHRNCLVKKDFTLRDTIALVEASDGIVGVDSCTQHMAYALNKKAIVLWGSTAVENVGYSEMTNIHRPGFPKEYVPYRFDFKDEFNQGAMDFSSAELIEISNQIRILTGN